MTKNITRSLFVLGLAAVAAYGFGCNPMQSLQDKASEKVAEGLLGQATGGKVDLSKDGTAVTYKDNKTGDSVAYGEDVKIPDDFPKDAAIYPGSKATNISISKSADKGAVAVLNTEDAVAKVMDWYKNEFKSWTEAQNMSINGTEYREYTKDNKKVSFTIGSETTDGKTLTTIMLTYGEDNPTPSKE